MCNYIEFLKEMFAEFGDIRARKMFGGHGIYHNDLMIGLVADDMLYLKVDAVTVSKFRHRGMSQFMYQKGQKMPWKTRQKCGNGRPWRMRLRFGRETESRAGQHEYHCLPARYRACCACQPDGLSY